MLYHATEEPQVKDLFYTKVVNYGILRSVKTYKSSHAEVFLGKGVLKISRKFTGEHSCRSVISMMLLCNFIEITSAWVFSCKSAAYFKNTFSYEHLLVSASEIKKVWQYILASKIYKVFKILNLKKKQQQIFNLFFDLQVTDSAAPNLCSNSKWIKGFTCCEAAGTYRLAEITLSINEIWEHTTHLARYSFFMSMVLRY